MQGGPHPSVTSVAAVMGLALLGDSLLYVVLPIHAAAFGVSFAWVGVLLSANRLVRIFAYGAIAEVSRRIGRGVSPLRLRSARLPRRRPTAFAPAKSRCSLRGSSGAWRSALST